MTQALQLAEVKWQQTGPDLMLTGYLPQSGGLRALAAAAAAADASNGSSNRADGAASAAGLPSSSSCGSSAAGMGGDGGGAKRHPGARLAAPGVAEFYKAWDRYGCLSNFSPHAISMPVGAMTCARLPEHQQHLLQQEQQAGTSSSSTADQQQHGQGQRQQWSSTEHYYQAQKFTGSAHPEATALVAAIAAAASPEEAAALGRRAQRQRPELLRSDWDAAKVSVMLSALRAKFAAHAGPRRLLLATARGGAPLPAGAHSRPSSSSGGLQLVESSPHDFFWGRGYDGSGANMLGKLLMQVRGELLLQQQQPQPGQQPPAQQQQQPAGV
jgi:diaminohydroxyphosphoribosylaminopyrimidine deaminase/5-amino-6-(5-phosphoribosylamino)uracil reductase